MGTSGLGNLLVEEGLLSESDRRTIRRTCGSHGSAFARAVLALGLLDEDELAAFLAERTRWKVVAKDLSRESNREASGAIDQALVQRLEVLPLRLDGQVLHVAMVDPLDHDTIKQIEFFSGYKVVPHIATLSEVKKGLERVIEGYQSHSSHLEELINNHAQAASRRQRLAEGAVAGKMPAARPAAARPAARPTPPVVDEAIEADFAAPTAASEVIDDDGLGLEYPDSVTAAEGAKAPSKSGAASASDSGGDDFIDEFASEGAATEAAGIAALDSMADDPLGTQTAVASIDPPGLGDDDDEADVDAEAAQPNAGAPTAKTSKVDSLEGLDELEDLADLDFGDGPPTTKKARQPASPALASTAPIAADVLDAIGEIDAESGSDVALGDAEGDDDLLSFDEEVQAATENAADTLGDDAFATSDDLKADGNAAAEALPGDLSEEIDALGSLADEDDALGTEDPLGDLDMTATSEADPLGDLDMSAAITEADPLGDLDMSAAITEADPLGDLDMSAAITEADLLGDLDMSTAITEADPLGDLDMSAPMPASEDLSMAELLNGATTSPEAEIPAPDEELTFDEDLSMELAGEPAVAAADEELFFEEDELTDAPASAAPESAGAESESEDVSMPSAVRVANLNRALIGLTMATDLGDAVRRAAAPLTAAGLTHGLILIQEGKQAKPIFAWHATADGAPKIDSQNLNQYAPQGLVASAPRYGDTWQPAYDAGRAADFKALAAWAKDGATLMATAQTMSGERRLVTIAAFEKGAADDQALTSAAEAVMKQLALKAG